MTLGVHRGRVSALLAAIFGGPHCTAAAQHCTQHQAGQYLFAFHKGIAKHRCKRGYQPATCATTYRLTAPATVTKVVNRRGCA